MFKPVANPVSRFDPRWVEYDVEEAPLAKLQVFEDHSRTVLTKNDSPDVGFAWSCNPYRGCQHACAYCYARPTHEYLDFGAGTDFDTKIVMKPRAAELVEEAFERRSWEGAWVLFSGNVDCYQPIEARYGLTRACLEVCLRYRNPCGVITRSAVIERDLDLLAELHREVGLTVTVSVPFHDAAAARLVEPHAPPPSRRFKTIARLTDAGIPVGVNVAPVIPGLTEEDIPAILRDARAAGARHATMILLRLSNPVREVFEPRVRAAFPDRADAIFAKIKRARGGAWNDTRFHERMRGQGEAWSATEQLFKVWRQKLGFEPWPERRTTPFRRPSRGQMGLFG